MDPAAPRAVWTEVEIDLSEVVAGDCLGVMEPCREPGCNFRP